MKWTDTCQYVDQIYIDIRVDVYSNIYKIDHTLRSWTTFVIKTEYQGHIGLKSVLLASSLI